MVMTPLSSDETDHVIMFIDISRAHPHCDLDRDLWIVRPEEDPRRGQPGVCGKLLRALYGSRDAGRQFELKVRSVMTLLDFSVGLFSPCIFKSESRNLQAYVYGDNFVLKGNRESLHTFARDLGQHMMVWTRSKQRRLSRSHLPQSNLSLGSRSYDYSRTD